MSFVKADAFIEHSGILGMKWGVRNGPPYPLGSGGDSKSSRNSMERRLNVAATSKGEISGLSKEESDFYKNAAKNWSSLTEGERARFLTLTGKLQFEETGRRTTYDKRVKSNELSNKELKESIERMENEKRYRQLMAELNPDKHARIKAIVKEALATVAKQQMIKLMGGVADGITDKMLGINKDKDKDKDKGKTEPESSKKDKSKDSDSSKKDKASDSSKEEKSKDSDSSKKDKASDSSKKDKASNASKEEKDNIITSMTGGWYDAPVSSISSSSQVSSGRDFINKDATINAALGLPWTID